jgi:hypothetical protein
LHVLFYDDGWSVIKNCSIMQLLKHLLCPVRLLCNCSFGEFAEATMHGYYSTPAAAAAAAAGSPARSPAAAAASEVAAADATPTSAKDVAPASVQLAAEAATRKRLQLLVSHE